ncbi:MAG: LuxR C-terminal-related transcriptional regulator [Solirubrobacteraceae bacterium]|nr:LuxR C-terminal-related transcriptional regulator [Solirubrobacteraceae bacterium]
MTTTEPSTPARAFPGPMRGPGWRRRESELAQRVAASHQAVAELLDGEVPLPALDRSRPGQTAEIVSALTWCCIERLRGCDGNPELARPLCEQVLELQQLALELHEHELSLRTRRLADTAAGLARLRTLPTSADLLDQVCKELVTRCGFGRVVLSRVEDGIWRPWMAHFVEGADIGWFSSWIDKGIPLADLPVEGQLLVERRPAVVYDTSIAEVHKPIIVDDGKSTSYVVAPVMPGDAVVGFLHADYHPADRRADDVDRDVLWAFAEGFGHIYERLVLLERLRAQRDHVRETLASTERLMDDLCDSGIDLARQADADTVVARSAVTALSADPEALSELTAREREVLELMVAGATNGGIAEQLVITEGTVKSHVKHILRKLGAVNRSQAIAQYLGIAQINND